MERLIQVLLFSVHQCVYQMPVGVPSIAYPEPYMMWPISPPKNLCYLPGLCAFTLSTPSQQGYAGYVLIQQQKTWHEAQVYCRQNHFDLVTVQSTDDWTNVLKFADPALTSLVWTGLYKNINSWLWSYQDEMTTFLGWTSEQPDNFGGGQNCVYLAADGWYDRSCEDLYPFFCYNENGTGANRFVLKTDISVSWTDAQIYCRLHHTDLATIRTEAENDQFLQMMTSDFPVAWIGLFRDSWKWSDGTKVKSIFWMADQPKLTGSNQPCGAAGLNGLMDDQLCSSAFPFICTLQSMKQTVRLEVKSGLNVNDPTVMNSLLQWIRWKLKDQGIEKDINVTWRLQTDGNVFSPKHNL